MLDVRVGGAILRPWGARRVSNTVTNNSISGNTLEGIRLEGGGNNSLAPPTITSYNGQRALGTVAGGIPDGRLVQLFSDADGEGLVLVGEGPVAGGLFSVVTGFVGDDLTATVTHKSASALVGRTDTSEFAGFFPASIGLSVSLANDPQIIPSAAPGALGVMALPLEVVAINGTVKVHSLTFEVEGSVVDDSDILQVLLYRDVDGDGRLGDHDEAISDPGSFAEDDDSVTLSLGEGVSVDTLSPQTWLVVLDLAGGAVLASNLKLSLLAGTSVSATVMLSPSIAVPVIGTFPIESDEIALVAGDIDSDLDSVVDVADICAGTIVGDAVDEVGCSCDQLDVAERFPTGDLIACPEPRAEFMLLTALAVIYGLRRRRSPETGQLHRNFVPIDRIPLIGL